MTVSLYAVDVDPCSGIETLRLDPLPLDTAGTQQFQPGAAPAGEVILRAGPADFAPNTRNYAIVADGRAQVVTKNGILSGISFQPIWLFIPPEILIFGEQMLPIGNFTIKCINTSC
jgi:hypothetical protein